MNLAAQILWLVLASSEFFHTSAISSGCWISPRGLPRRTAAPGCPHRAAACFAKRSDSRASGTLPEFRDSSPDRDDRRAQHHDADAVFAFQLIQHLARPLAHAGFVLFERLVAALDGPLVLFLRQARASASNAANICCAKSLRSCRLTTGLRYVIPLFREDVRLLGIGGFHRLRSRRHRRTRVRCHDS